MRRPYNYYQKTFMNDKKSSNRRKKWKESMDAQKELPRHVLERLVESEDYKLQGNFSRALKIAQKILQKDPSCIPAAEEVADNLLSLKEFEKAKSVAQFILSHNNTSYIANYVMGFLLLTDNKNKKALSFLTIANQASPNNPEILRCLGWARFHTGEEVSGIATLERALNLRAEDPLILCDLGVCLLEKQVFEKAIVLFEKALALDPSNLRIQGCLEAALSFKNSILQMQK